MSKKRIRQAIRNKHYEFTAHALEEMDDDDLIEEDVRRVLLYGTIEARSTDDPKGDRFVVRGISREIEIEVVCRFLVSSGWLRIITVYAVRE